MSFRDGVEADRRLIVLRVLVENGDAASESVIERALLALGERTEMDRTHVRRFLRELEERDCLVIELYRDKVMVATITKRGVAVAEGRVTVDGVSKPSSGI